MAWRYFDVVVLGRSLGALSAAAILARRDFRVLVLGQGTRPASYRFEGIGFRRRAFTWLSDACPTWKALLHELAQSPRFRRRLIPLDPMFLCLFWDRGLELAPDIELFAREIEREFPEVRQVVDELYATIANVNSIADRVFEKDLVWPPGTLWERLETRRAASELPWVDPSQRADPLARFPVHHPYRNVVTLPAQFASHLSSAGSALPPFALARLHGTWTRGLYALGDGEDELVAFLVERIEAHGGLCRLNSRASSIVLERDRVAGIVEEGEEEAIGTSVIVTDLPGESLAGLTQGMGITPRARRVWPQARVASVRYVLSVVVRTSGISQQLPQESFLIPEHRERFDPRRPPLHLQRFDQPADPSGIGEPTTLLVAELLLPVRGTLTVLEARDSILETLKKTLPFLEEHLIAVDSPYDGLPLWRFVDGSRQEVDRVHVRETSPQPEPMASQWAFDSSGFLDLGGEPLRGPIPGTYLVGPTVLPALGQEGELLASWSVARIVTRKDRSRQRMRRQMWRRVETA